MSIIESDTLPAPMKTNPWIFALGIVIIIFAPIVSDFFLTNLAREAVNGHRELMMTLAVMSYVCGLFTLSLACPAGRERTDYAVMGAFLAYVGFVLLFYALFRLSGGEVPWGYLRSVLIHATGSAAGSVALGFPG
jgi:hypothetical protein